MQVSIESNVKIIALQCSAAVPGEQSLLNIKSLM